jgi:hypothetical protein
MRAVVVIPFEGAINDNGSRSFGECVPGSLVPLRDFALFVGGFSMMDNGQTSRKAARELEKQSDGIEQPTWSKRGEWHWLSVRVPPIDHDQRHPKSADSAAPGSL